MNAPEVEIEGQGESVEGVTPDGASANAGEDVAITALPPAAPVAEVDASVEGENGETAAPRIATV